MAKRIACRLWSRHWVNALLALAIVPFLPGLTPGIAAAMGGPESAPISGSPPLASAPAGTYAGIWADEEAGIAAYRGIAYAAPPVGPLRWRPPQPLEPAGEVVSAARFGAGCPQPLRGEGDGTVLDPDRQSEDCLTLNIWTKDSEASPRPVMVWIHGGGHRRGAGSFPIYDGTELARQDVVLVTINYRLGYLGFFAHPALTAEAEQDAPLANYGTLDQVAALQWVRDNIAAFGGDPNNVTVFGESGGGAAALFLLTCPCAEGLFHRAIIQSGGGWQQPVSLTAYEGTGRELAAELGLPSDATAEDLRTVPAQDFVDALGGMQGLGFGPIVDGRLVTAPPWQVIAQGRAHRVPVIIGGNDHEASAIGALGVSPIALRALFGRDYNAARAAYGGDSISDEEFARQALGDSFFVAPARWVAARLGDLQPVYHYHFTYVATGRRGSVPGAGHGTEIPYIFRSFARLGPGSQRVLDAEDHAFAEAISGCWVSFAATGAPDCGPLSSWPAFAPGQDLTLVFGERTRVESGYRAEVLDLSAGLFETRNGL